MDYASPAVQLLGLVCSLLVCALAIFGSALFLREKSAGAWLMLAGSSAGLIGTAVPQGLYALENFVARHSGSIYETEIGSKVQSLMYYSIWNWLSTAAWLTFAIGFVLVALRRRADACRITELESILSQSAIRNPQSAISSSDLRH